MGGSNGDSLTTENKISRKKLSNHCETWQKSTKQWLHQPNIHWNRCGKCK